MAVAILGSDGQLGRHVPGEIRLGRGQADLADPASVYKALDAVRPNGVILTAAYTNVDGCESNRDYAMAVNGEGPAHVARWCQAHDAWVLYISSNCVFDGEKKSAYVEEDTPRPISVYGESKLAGELGVGAECPRHYIVRTSWLFGPGSSNFVTKVLQLASGRTELVGVADEIASPTYAPELAPLLPRLAASGRYGLYHLTNDGACSRLEYMEEILRLAGLGRTLQPIRLADFRRPSRPPAQSALANHHAAALGLALRPWREALAEYMER
ncbi:MAG: dTDP-4-dehydrorhamnose reductase [Chloroflexota bacterium]|nr:dTDP-4-dehydrorhamnose reductase [Chloroflexota bacterium]